MAFVRKRKLPSGMIRYEVAYTDGAGKRRAKLFARKGDADAWMVNTLHDLARGLHTAGSMSPTVKDAAALWIKRCNDKNLENMTVKGYEEHVDLHILPFIGAKKLSDLTVPAVNAFADQLRDAGRSGEMIRRVIRSLGGIFKEARRRGLANTAPTAGLDLDLPDRADPRPVIPSKAELNEIINRAEGRWRPLMLVAIFCGLRASELRGLRWSDIDFDARRLSVAQRADASHKLGKLKSKAAYRSIPCPPMVLNALREWKLVCPKGDLGLTFPNGIGRVESHANIVDRGLEPILKLAGLTEIRPLTDGARKPVLDAEAAPKLIEAGKYGMHSLRHACASLWIEGGKNPKAIQTLMGHSSIKVTYDVYGHLFADAEADQRAAEDIEFRLRGI
jgi:integrase